jgi:predicted transcriptional regulator of viral defense system
MKELDDLLPPTFTTKMSRAQGIHPRDLYAWRDSGQLIELSRGVFRRADAAPASSPESLAIAYRIPEAIICCLSAASIFDLTDVFPETIHIAIPKRSHSPSVEYPRITVFRFAKHHFELGLSQFEAAPREFVRIYDPARTVVDLMRFRRRFGEPLVHAALHRYLARQDAKPGVLLQYADALSVFGPMRSALDVVGA